jgi:hypothetical protein
MKLQFIFVALLCCHSCQIFGHIPQALLEKWERAEDHNAELDVIKEIGGYFESANQDSALYYYQKGIDLSKELPEPNRYQDFIIEKIELQISMQRF